MANQTTHLALGTLNGHDQLIVELVELADHDVHPAVIAIRWPSSNCDDTTRDQVAG